MCTLYALYIVCVVGVVFHCVYSLCNECISSANHFYSVCVCGRIFYGSSVCVFVMRPQNVERARRDWFILYDEYVCPNKTLTSMSRGRLKYGWRLGEERKSERQRERERASEQTSQRGDIRKHYPFYFAITN